jgi:hypothetical protein
MSDNPFKQNPLDKECKSLYKNSNSKCIFIRDECMNITKYNPNMSPNSNELNMYLMLLETQIFANITANKKTITYMVNNMMSLRSYLDSPQCKTLGIVLNELFCFVNTFQKSHYVHGKLNIDNIFVESHIHNPFIIRFRVIDLDMSMISSLQTFDDFYALQDSLIEYFNETNKSSLIMYLNSIVSRYTKSFSNNN